MHLSSCPCRYTSCENASVLGDGDHDTRVRTMNRRCTFLSVSFISPHTQLSRTILNPEATLSCSAVLVQVCLCVVGGGDWMRRDCVLPRGDGFHVYMNQMSIVSRHCSPTHAFRQHVLSHDTKNKITLSNSQRKTHSLHPQSSRTHAPSDTRTQTQTRRHKSTDTNAATYMQRHRHTYTDTDRQTLSLSLSLSLSRARSLSQTPASAHTNTRKLTRVAPKRQS